MEIIHPGHSRLRELIPDMRHRRKMVDTMTKWHAFMLKEHKDETARRLNWKAVCIGLWEGFIVQKIPCQHFEAEDPELFWDFISSI